MNKPDFAQQLLDAEVVQRPKQVIGERAGIPWWGKLIIALSIPPALGVIALVVFVIYVYPGPETTVYSAREIPAAYSAVVLEMADIDSDETIEFFYSDAMRDIRDGYVAITDKRAIIHDRDKGGLIAVAYSAVAYMRFEAGGVFSNSVITLELHDGSMVDVKLPTEQHGDLRVLKFFERKGIALAQWEAFPGTGI